MKVITSNKCPSCAAEVDTSINSICPHCHYQFSAGSAPSIIQPVRRVQKLSICALVALLIDITGSTAAFAKGVPLIVTIILKLIAAKARETKAFVHTSGDLDFDQQCQLIANGVSPQEAISIVGTLGYGGGGDDKETHKDSVETVIATTPWEPDARKWRNAFIALLTADSKPARSGVTARQLGMSLKDRNVLVYVVAEDYPFARELVEAAEGLFFPISNDPNQADMQKIAEGISQSILITAASTATRPMTVPMAAPQGHIA
jgi:hypothetical protein